MLRRLCLCLFLFLCCASLAVQAACVVPQCEGELDTSETLDPHRRPCQRKCECNNAVYTGECVLTRGKRLCGSVKRRSCPEVGRKRQCLAKDKKGACQEGTQTCAPNGFTGLFWGDCVPTAPRKETCNNIDDDCDGKVDNGIGCECVPGKMRDCYSGAKDTQGVGACKAGRQTCEAPGKWGACKGEVLPVKESCLPTAGQALDEDCDGDVDEGCDCLPGQSSSCFSGTLAVAGVGPCRKGTQTCTPEGKQGTCVGEVLPGKETCNNIDDDCNGKIDDNLDPASFGTPCQDRSQQGACVDGVSVCDRGKQVCQPGKPSIERCNGIDDDCNGTIDDLRPGYVCPSCIPTQLTRQLTGHTKEITQLSFNTTGSDLASSSLDGSIRIWNLASVSSPTVLKAKAPVLAIAYTYDGVLKKMLLAAAVGDQASPSIQLWDTSANPPTLYKEWDTSHTAAISQLVFSTNTNARQLASASADGAVMLWDYTTGKRVQSFSQKGQQGVSSLVLDGGLVYVADNTTRLHLWESLSGLGQFEGWLYFTSRILHIRKSKQNKKSESWMGMITNDRRLRLWDLKNSPNAIISARSTINANHRPTTFHFSYDNKMLVSAYDNGDILFHGTGEGMPLLGKLPGTGLPVKHLAIEPNPTDNTLASVYLSTNIRIWGCPKPP